MDIKSYNYKRGIKFLDRSSYVRVEGTSTLATPKYVFIPLKQFKGPLPLVMIEVGEEVQVGSILAKGRTCTILASVTGKVVAIEKRPSIYGGVCDHIIIETAGEDSYFRMPEISEEDETPEKILKRIYECGIVNNDGVPLYQKLTIEEGEKIDAIVVNACTDEPYLNSTIAMLNTLPNEVIKGIEYLVKCVGINVVKIAVTNKTFNELGEFMSVLNNYNGLIKFEISKVGDRYPIGDEDELVYCLKKKKLKKGQTSNKAGLIVLDATCCFEITQAMTSGYCGEYKLITVVGGGLNFNEQKNYWVKVGTTIGEILNQTRQGVSDNVTKIVVGGPMRGLAVSGLDCSITKTTKGVIFMSGMESALNLESACIGCGKCVEVCPKKLLPYKLDELSQNEEYAMAKKFGAEYCTKCGCCSFVCPAKRHLVQRIVYAKDVIEGRGGERL